MKGYERVEEIKAHELLTTVEHALPEGYTVVNAWIQGSKPIKAEDGALVLHVMKRTAT